MKTIIALLTILTIISCNCKGPKQVIYTPVKCVVDSVWKETPTSTLQFECDWYYRTSCGVNLQTRGSKRYSVGDTAVIYIGTYGK